LTTREEDEANTLLEWVNVVMAFIQIRIANSKD